jgi:hypothetical protein
VSAFDLLTKFSNFTVSKTLAADVSRMTKTKELLLARAESVVQEARAIAPVGDPTDPRYSSGQFHPGQYRDGIKASVVQLGDGFVGRVNAWDYKSNWIEFGTVNLPARHILTRAAEGALGQSVQAQKHAVGVAHHVFYEDPNVSPIGG